MVQRRDGRRQCTLAREWSASGTGLHTGAECRVTLSALGEDSGVQFFLPGAPAPFHAVAAQVASAERRTTLGVNGWEVSTVEHVLSALSGCGVDNCLVTVEGGEVPALDGSSLPFVDAICATGVIEQCADRNVIWLDEAVWVEHDGAQLLALPADRLRITYGISFDHPLLRQQMFSLEMDDMAYRQEIAPARTFGFMKEVQALRDRGLARGGTMENAVVLSDDGYLCPLRFGDEPVRHKILDLMGDLALLGAPLSAHVIGLKTSHSLNIELVRRILDTRRE